MKPTVIMGADGIEYVVSGGKLKEKCEHRTRRNESAGKVRKEVCHDCGKVLIYNPDTTRDYTEDSFSTFRALHGREPRGDEIFAML